MEYIKELIENWSLRLKSPFIGSIMTAFLILNWQPIWYLLFADRPARQKFIFFDTNTDGYSLLLQPLILGTLAALALPWIRLFGAWVIRSPARRLRNLQFDEAHDQKIYQLKKSTEEAEAKSHFDAATENALISAEKRLKDAKSVGGEKLSKEIEDDRMESSPQSSGNEHGGISFFELSILDSISKNPKGIFRISEINGNYSLITGDKDSVIPDRETFLKIERAIASLKKAGLIERDKDAISGRGYQFLEDNPLRDNLERN